MVWLLSANKESSLFLTEIKIRLIRLFTMDY